MNATAMMTKIKTTNHTDPLKKYNRQPPFLRVC
jgi:hypothetical protein